MLPAPAVNGGRGHLCRGGEILAPGIVYGITHAGKLTAGKVLGEVRLCRGIGLGAKLLLLVLGGLEEGVVADCWQFPTLGNGRKLAQELGHNGVAVCYDMVKVEKQMYVLFRTYNQNPIQRLTAKEVKGTNPRSVYKRFYLLLGHRTQDDVRLTAAVTPLHRLAVDHLETSIHLRMTQQHLADILGDLLCTLTARKYRITGQIVFCH